MLNGAEQSIQYDLKQPIIQKVDTQIYSQYGFVEDARSFTLALGIQHAELQ